MANCDSCFFWQVRILEPQRLCVAHHAALLLLGSVTGAQVGANFALQVRPERLRLVLAAIVLIVALRMLIGLTYRPEAIYTVSPL